MQILVLDTIHGGIEIGEAFVSLGHDVDMVDVYRNCLLYTSDAADE